MTVEVRRVQRLGNASLVVTIPKEWARRMGLRQGSTVVLVDEGDNIRIYPLGGDSSPGGAVIDAERVGRRLALLSVSCAYLSGYNSLVIRGAEGLEGEVRNRASKLLGVEVSGGNGSVSVKVLVDRSKIDVKASLKSMGFAASRLLGVLARGAESGAIDPGDIEEARLLKDDYSRHQHLIIRYLAQKGADAPASDAFHIALAAGYLGMLSDMVWGGISLLASMGHGESSAGVALAAREAGDLAILASRLAATPSTRRINAFLERVDVLRSELESQLKAGPGTWSTVALTTLHSAARILRILGYIAACKAVEDALRARAS